MTPYEHGQRGRLNTDVTGHNYIPRKHDKRVCLSECDRRDCKSLHIVIYTWPWRLLWFGQI